MQVEHEVHPVVRTCLRPGNGLPKVTEHGGAGVTVSMVVHITSETSECGIEFLPSNSRGMGLVHDAVHMSIFKQRPLSSTACFAPMHILLLSLHLFPDHPII